MTNTFLIPKLGRNLCIPFIQPYFDYLCQLGTQNLPKKNKKKDTNFAK